MCLPQSKHWSSNKRSLLRYFCKYLNELKVKQQVCQLNVKYQVWYGTVIIVLSLIV